MDPCTIIDESYTNAVQPENIILPMKDHQLKLLNSCLQLESGDLSFKRALSQHDDSEYKNNKYIINTNIGVIGNPVGSGKSLITMALMCNPIKEIEIYLDTSNVFNVYYDKECIIYSNINVLVVPHTIFLQWKKYIETQSTMIFEFAKNAKELQAMQFNKDHILLSASVYNDFAIYVNEKKYKFARIIYDEADSINLPNCKKINYNYCWFVTSSINNLYNPKGNCYNWNKATNQYDVSIVGIKKNGFIKQTFLALDKYPLKDFKSHVFLKNSEELIKQSFNLPDINKIKYICKNLNILNILNNLIPENIQQMIFAGDVEGAIKAIDIEKTNSTNLIKIVCNGFYEDIENKKIDLDSTKKKTYRNKAKQLEDIKKIENDILILETKIDNIKIKISESNMDPITFCEIEIPTIVKCCKQVFDFESITIYLTTTDKSKCPMCRASITKDSLIIVKELEEEEEETKEDDKEYIFEENDKIENLKYILQNKVKSNAKIIIFSSYDNSFTNIYNILDELNIEFKQLKGTAASINNTINWYKKDTDNKKVLFLNARYCGAGIELQMTDDVIIYHKMDLALETQVIGRGNRGERTTSLNVHHILYELEQ